MPYVYLRSWSGGNDHVLSSASAAGFKGLSRNIGHGYNKTVQKTTTFRHCILYQQDGAYDTTGKEENIILKETIVLVTGSGMNVKLLG